MKKFKQNLSLEKIKKITGGELVVSADHTISSVGDLSEADAHSAAFYSDEKFKKKFENSKAGLIFVKSKSLIESEKNRNYIITEKPYFAFLKLLSYFLEQSEENDIIGKDIHSSATIDSTTNLPQNVRIGKNVVIKKNVTLGDSVFVGDNSVIGPEVSIGKSTYIYPNVTIYNNCEIGNKVIIHAGTVIGSDGFGYMWDGNKQQKIPQIGGVIIKDEVELGSNVSVDRGALGNTIIQEDTKIDNLVQIGHNVIIGKHTIICSQTGIAGSSKIGNNVTLAGQVGVADHVKIGNNVTVAAMSGISKDVPDGKIMFGYPATEAGEQKRIIASLRSLPKLRKFLKRLQKRME